MPKTQFTPREGTETRDGITLDSKNDDSIYTPRGDGNSIVSIKPHFHRRLNLHPARGRKLDFPCLIYRAISTQFTPREGTETLVLFTIHQMPKTQFTPREGTETRDGITLDSKNDDSIYTPRGDGNSIVSIKPHFHRRLNLHPARGRKLDFPCLIYRAISTQFTPREGTETFI